MHNKYWNSETEKYILQYQKTKEEVIYNKYIYPALRNIVMYLIYRFGYSSHLWSTNEFVITVTNDLYDSLMKYKPQDNKCYAFFCTCAKNRILTYLTSENKEYSKRMSLDEMMRTGFDIADEKYSLWKL